MTRQTDESATGGTTTGALGGGSPLTSGGVGGGTAGGSLPHTGSDTVPLIGAAAAATAAGFGLIALGRQRRDDATTDEVSPTQG